LKIKHVSQLKPLLKPDDRAQRLLAGARIIAAEKGERPPLKPQDVLRRLAAAADPPKRSGSPKKSGKAEPELVTSATGKPVLRVEAKGRKELSLTLLLQAGATRVDAEQAIAALLSRYWLDGSAEEGALV
jgi:ParB family chromosome partitioning protein